MAASRDQHGAAAPPIYTRNSGLPKWAKSLQTDGDDEVPPDSCRHLGPELSELRSLSHEGRVRFHERKYIQQGDGSTLKKPQRRPENEEQLLYVALYRDKIAEQQAIIDAQKSKETARYRRTRQVESIVETSQCLSPGDRDFLLLDAPGAEPSASASAHEAEAAEGAMLPALSARRSRAPSGVDGVAGGGSARRGPRLDEHKKTTHIASVTSAPSTGGVASEYLETKRLGKLFDDWKLSQKDDVDESFHRSADRRHVAGATPSAASSVATPRGGAAAAAAQGAGVSAGPSPKAPRTSGVGRKSPPGSKGKGRGAGAKDERSSIASQNSGRGEASQTAQVKKKRLSGAGAEAIGLEQDVVDLGLEGEGYEANGSDTSERRGAGISESKFVSKLFQVVTNPQVHGEDGNETRRVPAYVEGFAALNLMRLYKGPWRLEC